MKAASIIDIFFYVLIALVFCPVQCISMFYIYANLSNHKGPTLKDSKISLKTKT